MALLKNTERAEFQKIEGLYTAAYRAYSNLSFDPEKRAAQIVREYEKQLNEDLETIPESEQEQYIANYTKYLFSWLSAMSNCYSVMITGGANFNNTRHDRTNNTERRKYDEFVEWREKAQKAINKRIEESKPIEQRASEKWESLKKQISQKIEWGSVANCYSMIERLAYNGEVELVENCLALVIEYNRTHAKPFVTSRHKIWALPEIANRVRAKNEREQEKESEESETNGVKVVKNYQADRIQLFFDGKPDFPTIDKLKHNAFKWSPSNGCWQRQLTNNAICVTEMILKANN